MWGGKLEFANMKLKSEALDSMSLPISVHYAEVGSICEALCVCIVSKLLPLRFGSLDANDDVWFFSHHPPPSTFLTFVFFLLCSYQGALGPLDVEACGCRDQRHQRYTPTSGDMDLEC